MSKGPALFQNKDNTGWMSKLAGRDVPPLKRETLKDLIDSRPFFEEMADVTELPELARWDEVVIWERKNRSVSCEVYVPHGSPPFPVLMHFHGGGWCAGSTRTERKHAMNISARGYVVFNVGYALAPEHPFPAALEDCVYATRWAAENAARYGGQTRDIVLEGGSAGANLAAATMLALASDPDIDHGGRRSQTVEVSALVLLYGIFDVPELLLEPGSNVGPAELWTRAYLGPHFSAHLKDPLVSPVFSESLSAFPPTYMTCGSADSLLNHTLKMANELARARVPVTVSVVEGEDHAFAKTPNNQAGTIEWERIDSWLMQRLPTDPAEQSAQGNGPSNAD